jgi:hypothetical protein
MSKIGYCPFGNRKGILVTSDELAMFNTLGNMPHLTLPVAVPLPDSTSEDKILAQVAGQKTCHCNDVPPTGDQVIYWEIEETGVHGWCCATCGYSVQWGGTSKATHEKKPDVRTRPYAHFKFPDEIIIEVKHLNEEQAAWYGAKDRNVYMFSCTNYGWFPRSLVAGVLYGKYHERTCLSKATGWIASNGNVGTAGEIFLADKIDYTISLLNMLGYIVEKVPELKNA